MKIIELSGFMRLQANGHEGDSGADETSKKVVRTEHVTERKGLLTGYWQTPAIDELDNNEIPVDDDLESD